jgi:hypothetical protein
MRYVRPDGSGVRVQRIEDGVTWVSGFLRVKPEDVSNYAPDWADGPTLGAVEHDVLGPAGWLVSRNAEQWCAHRRDAMPMRWRYSLAEALRDALEVLDG